MNLLDFLAEDGDHVEFFADGLGYGDIDLKNAGKSDGKGKGQGQGQGQGQGPDKQDKPGKQGK